MAMAETFQGLTRLVPVTTPAGYRSRSKERKDDPTRGGLATFTKICHSISQLKLPVRVKTFEWIPATITAQAQSSGCRTV